MRAFPAALERLTEQFARLPGIGSKTAQRLAFHVLSLPQDEAEAFAAAILDAKRTVQDRKSTRLNSSHSTRSRMPSSA